jgi:hypothetical protein
MLTFKQYLGEQQDPEVMRPASAPLPEKDRPTWTDEEFKAFELQRHAKSRLYRNKENFLDSRIHPSNLQSSLNDLRYQWDLEYRNKIDNVADRANKKLERYRNYEPEFEVDGGNVT